jgi:hypothetical protein
MDSITTSRALIAHREWAEACAALVAIDAATARAMRLLKPELARVAAGPTQRSLTSRLEEAFAPLAEDGRAYLAGVNARYAALNRAAAAAGGDAAEAAGYADPETR